MPQQEALQQALGRETKSNQVLVLERNLVLVLKRSPTLHLQILSTFSKNFSAKTVHFIMEAMWVPSETDDQRLEVSEYLVSLEFM